MKTFDIALKIAFKSALAFTVMMIVLNIIGAADFSVFEIFYPIIIFFVGLLLIVFLAVLYVIIKGGNKWNTNFKIKKT